MTQICSAGLGKDKGLQGRHPLPEGLKPPGPPGTEGWDVIHRKLYGVGEDRCKKNARGLDRVRGQNSLQRPHFKTDSKSESKFAIIYTNLEFLQKIIFPP